jgi:hypothetical protein
VGGVWIFSETTQLTSIGNTIFQISLVYILEMSRSSAKHWQRQLTVSFSHNPGSEI